MTNKELFYDICNRYGIETSTQFDKPMIREGENIRNITNKDIYNLCQYNGEGSHIRDSAK